MGMVPFCCEIQVFLVQVGNDKHNQSLIDKPYKNMMAAQNKKKETVLRYKSARISDFMRK